MILDVEEARVLSRVEKIAGYSLSGVEVSRHAFQVNDRDLVLGAVPCRVCRDESIRDAFVAPEEQFSHAGRWHGVCIYSCGCGCSHDF